MFLGDVTTVLGSLMGAPIPRVSSIVPQMDPRVDAIVARALEKDPQARYQTAADMRSDIEAYLAATGAIVGQRDLENLLRSYYAEHREARIAEVRGVMQRLDRRTNSSGLETLRPLQTASRPGTSGHTPSGIKATPSTLSEKIGRGVASDLAELAQLAPARSRPGSRSGSRPGSRPGTRPSVKGRTEGGPDRVVASPAATLAADLAELGAPDALAPGRAPAPRFNWLLVAVVVATIAALIGWLR
jgi:serine/threonine-protein kinase